VIVSDDTLFLNWFHSK